MTADWEKTATNLKGIIPVVKVDATVEKQLASNYGVKGYPTIKLFTPGAAAPTDYKGARTAKDFVDFALNSLPNNVMQVTAKNVDSFFTRAPEAAPRVLLFTSKSATPPLFKSLAMRFKDKLVFGEIKQSNKDLCAQYNVDSFPTILVLTDRNAEAQKFEGKIDPTAVTAFVQGFVGQSASSTSGSGSSGASQGESGSAKPTETPKPAESSRPSHTVVPGATSKFEILSGDLLTCGTLCVVAVVDTDEESKPNEEQLKTLETLVARYGKDEKFAFRWLAKSSENGKAALAKLKTDKSPLVAVVNTKRSKYVVAPEFSDKALSVLLDRVIGGDAQYEKL